MVLPWPNSRVEGQASRAESGVAKSLWRHYDELGVGQVKWAMSNPGKGLGHICSVYADEEKDDVKPNFQRRRAKFPTRKVRLVLDATSLYLVT